MNMNQQRTEKASRMNKVVCRLTSEEIELVGAILNIFTIMFFTISFTVGLYLTICLIANYFTSPAAIKATKIVIVLLYLYSVLCGVGQFGVRKEKKSILLIFIFLDIVSFIAFIVAYLWLNSGKNRHKHKHSSISLLWNVITIISLLYVIFSYFIDNLELCYIYNGNLFLKYGFFVLIFMLFIFLITSTVLFYQKNVNGSIRKRNAFNNLITLFDPNYINAKETIKSEVDGQMKFQRNEL